MKLTGKVAISALILAAGAVSAFAQPVISAKSGMVSRAEGEVFLADKPLADSPATFPEVKENSVLRTEQGRAEVLLTRGVYMRIGETASFKMLTSRLIDTRLELLTGSAIVEADEINKDNNLTILAGEATMSVNKHGLFRFDMGQGVIKVFEGTATVEIKGQTQLVGAGRLLKLQAGGQGTQEKFNKDDTDALDHWSKRRAEQIARANPSSARQVYDAGCAPGMGNGRYGNGTYGSGNYNNRWAANANPINTNNPNNPCYNPCGWSYNTWYGIVTYIPCTSNVMNPYGYRYWTPSRVMGAFYRPAPPTTTMPNSGYGNNFPGMSNTSGGYSGAMVNTTSSVNTSAPAAAATSSTTAGSAASSSTAGHGAAGGHGK